MVPIAKCESNLTHYSEDGEVLRGKVHSPDTGVMQINKKAHGERLDRLDLDVDRLWDNLSFGRLLYEESEEYPWVCRKHVALRS